MNAATRSEFSKNLGGLLSHLLVIRLLTIRVTDPGPGTLSSQPQRNPRDSVRSGSYVGLRMSSYRSQYTTPSTSGSTSTV
jgi:hypothetical protein